MLILTPTLMVVCYDQVEVYYVIIVSHFVSVLFPCFSAKFNINRQTLIKSI